MGTIKSYFIGITIIFLIIIGITWLRGNEEHLKTMIIFAAAFEIGAISATIASKVYKRW
jgi:hypothetical protein